MAYLYEISHWGVLEWTTVLLPKDEYSELTDKESFRYDNDIF